MSKGRYLGWRVGIFATLVAILGVVAGFGISSYSNFRSAEDMARMLPAAVEAVDDAARYLESHKKAREDTRAKRVTVYDDNWIPGYGYSPFLETTIADLDDELADRDVRILGLESDLVKLRADVMDLELGIVVHKAYMERQLLLGGAFTILLTILLVMLIVASRRSRSTYENEAS